MAIAFALANFSGQQAQQTVCTYDRDHLMSLNQNAFDQDLDGGWRVVARQPGCRLAAADLIRDYRQLRQNEAGPLFWHEGQLRALEGQTSAALALLERARSNQGDPIGWNHYLDATVAFLRGDRPALAAARERLARHPRPEGFSPLGGDNRLGAARWPPNLNIVDALIACFGRPYSEAYHPNCEPDRRHRN